MPPGVRPRPCQRAGRAVLPSGGRVRARRPRSYCPAVHRTLRAAPRLRLAAGQPIVCASERASSASPISAPRPRRPDFGIQLSAATGGSRRERCGPVASLACQRQRSLIACCARQHIRKVVVGGRQQLQCVGLPASRPLPRTRPAPPVIRQSACRFVPIQVHVAIRLRVSARATGSPISSEAASAASNAATATRCGPQIPAEQGPLGHVAGRVFRSSSAAVKSHSGVGNCRSAGTTQPVQHQVDRKRHPRRRAIQGARELSECSPCSRHVLVRRAARVRERLLPAQPEVVIAKSGAYVSVSPLQAPRVSATCPWRALRSRTIARLRRSRRG